MTCQQVRNPSPNDGAPILDCSNNMIQDNQDISSNEEDSDDRSLPMEDVWIDDTQEEFGSSESQRRHGLTQSPSTSSPSTIIDTTRMACPSTPTPKRQLVSPLTLKGRLESPLMIQGANASLSKLDRLRAHNKDLRQRGSRQTAETRQSLLHNNKNSSASASLHFSQCPSLSWDESTLESASCRTWMESPLTSRHGSAVFYPEPIPAFSPPLSPWSSNGNSIHNNMNQINNDSALDLTVVDVCQRRLEEENKLLQRQVRLMQEHHELQLQTDHSSWRQARRERAKARTQRFWLILGVLLVACVGHLATTMWVSSGQETVASATVCDLSGDNKRNHIQSVEDDDCSPSRKKRGLFQRLLFQSHQNDLVGVWLNHVQPTKESIMH